MKKIISIGVFFAFFVFVALIQANAQLATSNCSQVIVTQIPAPPPPPPVLNGQPIVIPNGTKACASGNGSCCLIALSLFDARRFFLEKKNNNGAWSLVSTTPQLSTTFSNLSSGTYRVKIEYPGVDFNKCSNSTPVPMRDVFTAQIVGFLGTYLSGTSTVFTNEVVVGSPVQSDNSLTFLNGNGRYRNNNPAFDKYFDINEVIRIDASACKNFNDYQINIQEFWYGDPNFPVRWRNCVSWSNPANRPLGIENISTLWNPFNDPNWVFIPGNSYRLQLTIRNSNCASWVDNLPIFYVCDPSLLCRGGNDQAKIEPSISPNPVSNTFKLNGIALNPLPSSKDVLVIHDLAGRAIKNFTNIREIEFDVSDIISGVYFVSVLRDNHKLFTKKLVINR